MMIIFLAIGLCLIAGWATMFYSIVYRWYVISVEWKSMVTLNLNPMTRRSFLQWPFLGCFTVSSFLLLISSLTLGVVCRVNFGKGLAQYCNFFLFSFFKLAESHHIIFFNFSFLPQYTPSRLLNPSILPLTTSQSERTAWSRKISSPRVIQAITPTTLISRTRTSCGPFLLFPTPLNPKMIGTRQRKSDHSLRSRGFFYVCVQQSFRNFRPT